MAGRQSKREARRSLVGKCSGQDLLHLVQLLTAGQRDLVAHISMGNESGLLAFEGGRVRHASTASNSGEAAFFEMCQWPDSEVELRPGGAAEQVENVTTEASRLVMEVASGSTESAGVALPASSIGQSDGAGIATQTAAAAHPADAESAARHTLKEESAMAMKEQLEQFNGIDGFRGAAVFSPQGEMLESLTASSKIDIKTIGLYANNALLNAQKATDQMGVGRGNLMQIRAPQAIVLMRCLNEATDFAMTKEGKAHIHTVVILDPEGNVGMAGLILDKIQGALADAVR